MPDPFLTYERESETAERMQDFASDRIRARRDDALRRADETSDPYEYAELCDIARLYAAELVGM